ncbi:MAG: FAD-dependent oxidoreductase [Polyangiaceae bacterium]
MREREAWLIERRALLRGSMASLAALAAGCGSDPEPATTDVEVAVVGGGMAGLHCAYRLHQAGVAVTVFESSDRVGGRMYTARGMFPDGQLIELGGELIDTNHATLWALSAELGIALDDRFADEPAGFKREIYDIGGVEVPEATIVEQFTQVAPLMAQLVTDAEEDDALFEMVDGMSLREWLDTNVPVATYPELNAVLDVAYRGEFGLENDEQSPFNLLYLIDYEEPDPFRIFGDSDERHHTHDGNDAFPNALATALEGRIELGATLVRVSESDGRYTLELTRGDGSSVERVVDHVVFALPFTRLRDVDLTGVTLSDEKRTIIAELGYGTNAKVMGAFTSRIWRDQYNQGGSLTTDRPVQQTWDTSIGQDGAHGILTNFLGGDQGVASGQGTAEAWFTGVLPDLEAVWPDAQNAYVADSAVRMHWPTHPHTLGSYTCYRPGQWAFWSLEGVREGNLHFCGEHCSLDFQGWMEGAAETGGLVAKEILDELGVKASTMHVAALESKLALPQACYGASRFGPMRVQQRRRLTRGLSRSPRG